jgi:hypothetical protein
VAKKALALCCVVQNVSQTSRTLISSLLARRITSCFSASEANDANFQPTPEAPALQFLEHVEKDSSADKAGLKPLDFVLEVSIFILLFTPNMRLLTCSNTVNNGLLCGSSQQIVL